MEKILITGSSGLVGRNIVDKLYNRYNLVIPKRNELDLLEYKEVLSFFRSAKPDIVIHCAGVVGGIQANIDSPVKFLSDNSYIGLNVINAAYYAGIQKVLNMASSCMYPRNVERPLKEELILKGELEPTNEGYAIAKILTTRLCEYYSKTQSSLIFKTLIPCNLYGKYDKFDSQFSHMIPSVIRKIHYAKVNGFDNVEIWGTGESKREFMYAEDLADFIVFALQKIEKLPSVLNVGTGVDYTINEYYKIVAEVIGYKGSFIHNTQKPEGMQRKLVDVTRLNELGWKYKTSLRQGILETYKYYLSMEKK